MVAKIRNNIRSFGIVLSILLSSFYVLIFYHSVVIHPNTYLFSNNNDGLKTYYNILWHSTHDKQPLEFNGMSYPYGEYLIFEDSVPFLSIGIQQIARFFPEVNRYGVGILNLLIIISMVVGTVFMFLVLYHYSVPLPLAVLSGCGIIFLSSQTLLLNPAGHMGLAMVCFFPMGWFLLIKFFENKSPYLCSGLIAINILCWNAIHVYLGLILLIFTFSVHISYLIFNKRIQLTFFARMKYLSIQVILPVLIILFFFQVLDSHPDRIDMPFIVSHRASFQSVFLPVISFFSPVYQLLFAPKTDSSLLWNAIGNYIGIVSNIALIVFFLIVGYYLIVRKLSKVLLFFPSGFWHYLFSGLVLLLFSMAIPLRFIPEKLVEYIPLIKQFSALGRFAWGFYYIISAFAIIFFVKLFYTKLYGRIVVYVFTGLLLFESFAIHEKISKRITSHPNVFTPALLPESYSILKLPDKASFQAILPLPYFFKFNLPFGTAPSDSAINGSMISSIYTGLPIMSTYLSRPSVQESLSIFKMFMPPPYKRAIPEILKNGKDLAIIVHSSDTLRLNTNEKQLLQHATLWKASNGYLIYQLPVTTFSDSLVSQSKASAFLQSNPVKSDLNRNSNTGSFIYYNGFDTLQSPEVYKGTGAFYGLKEHQNLLFQVPTKDMDTTLTYYLSFWYYNHLWDQSFTTVLLEEKEPSQGILSNSYYSPLKVEIIDGWWYYSKHSFKIKSNQSQLYLYLWGSQKFEPWFIVDEVSIYSVH